MAAFGTGPFDNEIALDLLADLRRRRPAARQRIIATKLAEYQNYIAARKTGSADLRLSDVELRDLVAAFLSLEDAVSELGLVERGGAYYLSNDGVPSAQAALAGAAIVAGESSSGDEALCLNLSPCRNEAIRTLQLLATDVAVLQRWFGESAGDDPTPALQARIHGLLISLQGR